MYLVKYIYNYIVIVFWSALVKITSVTGSHLKDSIKFKARARGVKFLNKPFTRF